MGYKTPIMRSLERTQSSSSSPRSPKTPKRNESLNSIIPRNTPVVRNVNNTKGAFPTENADKRYIRYAEEARRWIIGPMPTADFLDFLPPLSDSETMPDPTNAFDLVPSEGEGKDERQIYGVLNAAINDKNRCPSVKFYDTSTRPEQPGLLSYKPDIIAYDTQDPESFKDVKNGNAPAKLGAGELSIEVKIDGTKQDQKEDPFQDPDPASSSRDKHCFLTYLDRQCSKERREKTKKTLGQITAYAVEACGRQHRTHYFSILIIGSKARFIRWDRAGAIVSEKFDYKEQPGILCEFLWRFHLADPVQRGYDPTVVKATAVEEAIFKDTIAKHVALQLDVDETQVEKISKAVERFYEKDKVTKIDVYDETTDNWQQHLVSVPVTTPESLAGRATRGYWSVKIEGSDGVIGFLKDTWRIEVPKMYPEDVAYQDMGALKVNGRQNVDKEQKADEQQNVDEEQTADEQQIAYRHQKVDGISGIRAFGDVRERYEDVIEVSEQMDQFDDLIGATESSILPEKGTDAQLPPVQCTRTNDFKDEKWVCRGGRDRLTVTKHTHYRLVLDTVGYPLKDFIGSRELFEAAADVFEILVQAYERCNRLHRDVSLGNIILVRFKRNDRRKGVLVDWEFSTTADGEGIARDYLRSGTWAYMSAASLMDTNDDFRHRISDDLESLLYVLIYCSVRWLRHKKLRNLGLWINVFFHFHYAQDGKDTGGAEKYRYLNRPDDFTKKFKFENTLVEEWFRTAYEYLKTTSDLSTEQKWTIKWLQPLYKSIRNRLPNHDRLDHELEEEYQETEQVYRATRTSRPSKLDSTRLVGSGSRGSKRPLEEANEEQQPAAGSMPPEESRGNKRSRFDIGSGEGASGHNRDEERHVNSRRSSKKSSRRHVAVNSLGSGRGVEGRPSSRRGKGSAQSSTRNSSSRPGERRSLRLKEKASASSIKR